VCVIVLHLLHPVYYVEVYCYGYSIVTPVLNLARLSKHLLQFAMTITIITVLTLK